MNKPKNKLIKDLRVYYNGLPNKALYPYDYIYTEIFLNLLAREGLMCPTYNHLYIQVAKTFDEALKNSFSMEDWHVNGLSVIDFENFQILSDEKKENQVFQTILSGLKDIATIDKLDAIIIEKVADKINEVHKLNDPNRLHNVNTFKNCIYIVKPVGIIELTLFLC